MARTIQSPGVEIREVDLSLRANLPVGTTVLISGFSQKGPTDEVLEIASLSEFEQIYGTPSNAMERYFYHTVKAAKNSPANIIVSRLPYGSGSGQQVGDYSALFFPVYPQDANGSGVQGTSLTSAANYYIGAPQSLAINEQQYNELQSGSLSWSDVGGDINIKDTNIDTEWGKSGFIIVNDRKNVVNEQFEGYYVGLLDNTNLNPATDFDGIREIFTVNDDPGSNGKNTYIEIPSEEDDGSGTADNRLTFPLSAAALGGKENSVSEVMENIAQNDLSTEEFSDILTLGVFKIRQSVLDPDTTKLDYVLVEAYHGSLNSYRQQFPTTGGPATSYFIEDIINMSPNIRMYVNPNISKNAGDWFDSLNAKPTKRVRTSMNKLRRTSNGTRQFDLDSSSGGPYLNSIEFTETSAFRETIKEKSDPLSLFAVGNYKKTNSQNVTVGNIPSKLERIFELVDNHELYPLDVVCDAGLSTIFVGTSGGTLSGFDDEKEFLLDGTSPSTENLYTTQIIESPGDTIKNYRFVMNSFINFTQNKRKDCLYIADPLRYIFVQGKNSKTLDQPNPTDLTSKKNFSQHIYWPLRHLFGSANSSYACTYANWVSVFDSNLGRGTWQPFSGFAAAMLARTDANFFPWVAPAGFTRGVLSNAADIAVYPKQKHRDQLYKINLNPIANFPNDGFVVFGQKTLQSKPSAFDRINVRRLFLYLEKATRATVKYFVFEPNTLFTRTQVVNVLTPIFENAKNTDGMYDYLIICDERNNTPDVIDQNELVVDIYIKPVRAAEFILVNFYATRTGQDFNELVS